MGTQEYLSEGTAGTFDRQRELKGWQRLRVHGCSWAGLLSGDPPVRLPPII